MKKLLNDPNNCADELVDGLIEAYNGEVIKVGARSLARKEIADGKVALLVGGGAGHEPIYHGLVGRNLADGAACGDIFAAPPPDIVLDATKAVNRGNGVLYLYGNYAGDVLNFDMGAELAQDEDIEVRTVLIWDDVASAGPDRKEDRRGIAGLVPVVKLAGAASQIAPNLDELERMVVKARDNTRSIGVALAPGSIPATGEPTFELAEDEIGIGMGIHGEKGVRNDKMMSADELTEEMFKLILADDLELNEGDEILFFVNSLGSTTMMELLICMRRARQILSEKGLRTYDVLLGPMVTCQEMAGISFSITKLDEELKKLWDMPCESFCYSKMEG